MNLARRLFAEALGSALLFATVIGSGIMAAGLSTGNPAVALLGNTLATAAMLFVLVTIVGPVSGAHFNPAVTLVFALRRAIAWPHAGLYVVAQLGGGLAGVLLAHGMFDLPLLQASVRARTGGGQWLGEATATFALVLNILGCVRHRPHRVPAAVAMVITAGYWWTSSTSFANPAISLARAFTDSFSGIRLADVPGFVAAQFAGALAAHATARWLFDAEPPPAAGAPATA